MTKKCHHVRQCAAVRSQLGAISVAPQVGKKDSREAYRSIEIEVPDHLMKRLMSKKHY